jgi:hypothetical protein
VSADRVYFNPTRYAAYAAALCLLVFLRALTCDFINWDDPLYVIDNPAIRILDVEFIQSAFMTSYMGWWMPLTWISFAIDYQFWELNPFGYHLTNILLHAANTGLVVLIADQLLEGRLGRHGLSERQYAAVVLLAGLLWGIHPLRVESVVWVTERKDVLNGIFALGSILAYLRYVKFYDNGKKALPYYLGSLLLLVMSFMAKPVSAVIPAMLLVLDWYPLNRIKSVGVSKIMAEKLPFFSVSALYACVTLYFASNESILVSYQDFPLYLRTIQAGNAIFEYVHMTFFPVGLINLYLLPKEFPATYTIAACASLIATTFFLFSVKRRPWLLAVWILFLLPLIPVLGFFQNGAQSYADRFTYLPSVALSIAASVAVARAMTGRHGLLRMITSPLAFLVLAVFGVISFNLVGVWKNSETLWSRVINIQPVGRAYYLRAEYYMQNGRYGAAIEDLSVSVRMGKDDGYPGVFYLLALRGDALIKAQQYGAAVNDFSAAIRLKPYDIFFYHRGIALKALGRNREADIDFRQAGGDNGPIDWKNFLDN